MRRNTDMSQMRKTKRLTIGDSGISHGQGRSPSTDLWLTLASQSAFGGWANMGEKMNSMRLQLQGIITALVFLTGIACGGRSLDNNSNSGITGTGNATVAPTVTAISPANNATGAYIDAPIQITFSTAVNLGTVTMTSNTTCTGSVQVSTDANFGSCIAMNQNISQSGTQITVRTAALMTASTAYYVRVTTAVAGSTGLTMVTQFNSTFTTGTNFAPLTGEFGADCSAGASNLTAVRAETNGAAINHSVPNLVVTAVDTTGYFFLQQAGATGPAVYIRDTTNAPNVAVQVGDIVCVTITEKDEYNSWVQIDAISAIKKTGAGGSVTPQVVTAAVTDDTYETEMVSMSGTLTTKSTTVAGGGYNHVLTYAGGTITLREIQGSGKFDNLLQGQAVQVVAPMTQFNTSYQVYIDNKVGTVSEYTGGNFNVSSASATSATTVTLTFNNTPTTAAATNVANYAGNNGLTITNATLSGITVTLTTSTQSVGQSYTITVSNVLRSADNAALTTNSAAFTGYVPAATFTTGQVIINEVNIAPTNGTEEYVELYNTTATPLSLNGATIWYKSSAGVPGQASTLTGVIPANGYYTLLRVAAPAGYTCTGTTQTTGWGNSGLSNTAGAVVLTVDGTAPTATTDANIRDVAQWATNTTNWGEGGTTAPSPGSNRTIARAPNGTDTNNTSNDFIQSTAANGTCGANNWAGDSTAPTITSTTPADAATGIATNTSIAVQFSESMVVSSVITARLYLVAGTNCAATAITGTITPSSSNTTYTFSPGTLSAATQYSICIKTGVQDAALNTLAGDVVRSFTTIAPDTTPPTISSTTPANSASGVAIGTTVAVTFNEAMSTGTVTGQTNTTCSGSIQLSSDNFSTCVAMTSATPAFSGGNTVATLTPAAALSNSTTYKIRVTTAVQDVAGNALATQFETAAGFTTAAADVTPPTISSTTPANGATSVSTGTTVAVTFSEAMSTGTVTAQTSAGACTGSVQVSLDNFSNCIAMSAAAPTFSGGNTVATFTPAAALTASTTYKIRVTTAVQDASNNALAAQFETATGFTTGSGGGTATDLFISEYLEGNSNNKCLEIFNGTGATVDASTYRLALYTNGSATVSASLVLSGLTSFANNATYTVCHASLSAGTGITPNLSNSTPVNFNGDDHVSLQKDTGGGNWVNVDVFGSNLGTDPGTCWLNDGSAAGAGCTAGNSTVDTIWRRNATIVSPTTTWTASQWTKTNGGSDVNITANHNFGSHTFTP